MKSAVIKLEPDDRRRRFSLFIFAEDRVARRHQNGRRIVPRIERHGINETPRLEVMLQDGPAVPDLVDRPIVQMVEILFDFPVSFSDVLGKSLIPRQSGVGRQKGDGYPEPFNEFVSEKQKNINAKRKTLSFRKKIFSYSIKMMMKSR